MSDVNLIKNLTIGGIEFCLKEEKFGQEHLMYHYVGNFELNGKNIKVVFDVDEEKEVLEIDPIAQKAFEDLMKDFQKKYSEIVKACAHEFWFDINHLDGNYTNKETITEQNFFEAISKNDVEIYFDTNYGKFMHFIILHEELTWDSHIHYELNLETNEVSMELSDEW